MWLLYLIIENTQICHQLGEIAGFKIAGFQFHDHETVQLAIEEEQVGKEVVRENLKMILIADESKIPPEGHNEFLDVVDNLFLYHPLVNILIVADPDFFGIDEVEEIFILKHIESLECIATVLDGHSEIGWHHTVMVGDIFLDLLLKETCVPLVFKSQFNVFPAFGNIFSPFKILTW